MLIYNRIKLACMVFAAMVVMGCAIMAGESASAPAPIVRQPDVTITMERANEIALEQAGGGTVVKSELHHRKDGRIRYDVLVVDGDSRIEVKMDAVDGQVLAFKRELIEKVKYPKRWSVPAHVEQDGIDVAQAREIALAKTGGGTIVELEREFKKDGRIVYEIEVVDAERKYELELDGRSGAIIEYEEKVPKHLRGRHRRD